MDATGGHVFALDAGGGSLEDRFVSIGSGSPFVYGFLEDAGKEIPSVSEGVDLSLRGLTAAMRRDSASGDGSAVAEITDAGYGELGTEEIQKRLARLKLSRQSHHRRPRAARREEFRARADRFGEPFAGKSPRVPRNYLNREG